MRFLSLIDRIPISKLDRFRQAIKDERLGAREEIEGIVIYDYSDLMLDFQKICDTLAEELFQDSDHTGFPKAQSFWHEHGFAPQDTIGDVVKHFIMQV